MFKILNKKNQSNLESRKYSTQQNSLRLLKKFYPPIYKFMEYLASSQDKVNIHIKRKSGTSNLNNFSEFKNQQLITRRLDICIRKKYTHKKIAIYSQRSGLKRCKLSFQKGSCMLRRNICLKETSTF